MIAGQAASRSDPPPQLILALIGQTFGAPALSIFYMASLVLLARARPPGHAWREAIASASQLGTSSGSLRGARRREYSAAPLVVNNELRQT